MGESNSMKYYNSFELWTQTPNQYQLDVCNMIVQKIPQDVKSILDVGSGNGIITNQLANKYERVCALDISEEALKHVKTEKVIGSIDQLPFSDGEFDLILISDVLEHLPPDVFHEGVKELQRVAKKYVLVVTPFQEKLDFGQMTCIHCRTEFHVNLHIHSISKKTIEDAFCSNFKIKEIAFSGDEWPHIPLYAKYIKSLYSFSNNWEHAVCPQCGVKQNDNRFVYGKKETDPKFYHTVIDSFHKVAEQFRMEEFSFNECLFLLEKNAGNNMQDDSSIHLILESKVPFDSIEIISDGKWNIDFSNPFFERNHTVYFSPKPYVLSNNNLNLSNIIKEQDKEYRVIGPKEDGSNHSIFIIPKFTENEFALSITYQDISTEALMVNVYDREKSYVPIDQLDNKGDMQWKTKKITVPSGIKCPPEGFVFELAVQGGFREYHPIKYVSVEGLEQQNRIVTPIKKDNGKTIISLDDILPELIHTNCFVRFYFSTTKDDQDTVPSFLEVNGTKIWLQSVVLNGRGFVELPSEVFATFFEHRHTDDKEDVAFLRNRASFTVNNQEKLKKNQNVEAELQARVAQFDELHQKYEKELVKNQNIEAELQARVVQFNELHKKYEATLVKIQNVEAEREQYKLMKEKYEADIVQNQNLIASLQQRIKELENRTVLDFILKRKR
ncbi:methyltransferase domain-containing protein [Aneurinibacillus sp. UBA3580]|jgi:ubiquinone/menaquinone biosynthesis C-methylase UbiE|uniref:methyltransferase domain-containing protein n=1 Tax=Aneurinibacillus sp. UBA3580 TaxID=1946041 RepID=UPI00257DCA6C|nr:methyltransferase domain-containing protein [Aneurinibacillus sp. UBA3580]